MPINATYEESLASSTLSKGNASVATRLPLPSVDESGDVLAPLERKASLIRASRAKRAVDILGAGLGLLFLWPLMLMVAIAIKLDSPGPVLFRQQRYGACRTPFMIFKFRSMRVMESHGDFVQARAGDARITRVGAFLRASSIDELPQLFNVLRGDMSLVGPRPHALVMDDELGDVHYGYADRHLVKPGLTGLAQVDGFRGPTDSAELVRERIRRDRIYIRTWTIWSDLRVLIQTPISLLLHKAF